jgi:hypothetical protein
MLGGIYRWHNDNPFGPGGIPINYLGTWNASTNTPVLASGTGSNGDMYVVNVAGSTVLDGNTDWEIGDWAVFNGTTNTWQKIDNSDKWVADTNGITYSGQHIGIGGASNSGRAIAITAGAASGILGTTTVGDFELDFVGKVNAFFDMIGQTAACEMNLTAATSANIKLNSGTGDSFIALQSTSGAAYIEMTPEVAPGVTTGKLYNIGGVLYWAGNPVSAGADQWTADTNGLTTTASHLGLGGTASETTRAIAFDATGSTGIRIATSSGNNDSDFIGAVNAYFDVVGGTGEARLEINGATSGYLGAIGGTGDGYLVVDSTSGSAFIQIAAQSAPADTGSKLYNVAGVLTWNGKAVLHSDSVRIKGDNGNDYLMKIDVNGEPYYEEIVP